MKHLLAAVICAGLIVLWYLLNAPRADGLCMAWAEMVEQLEQMPSGDRQVQLAAWQEMTTPDTETRRYVMSAVNWLEQGNTSEAAWQECESF